MGGDAHGDGPQPVLERDLGRAAAADGVEEVDVLEVAGPVVQPLVGDGRVVHVVRLHAADPVLAAAADADGAGRDQRLDLAASPTTDSSSWWCVASANMHRSSRARAPLG